MALGCSAAASSVGTSAPKQVPGRPVQGCNLARDRTIRSVPEMAKPPYLTAVTDPVFGTRITRITGDPGDSISGIPGGIWGRVARHHYSKDQAWNADESLIFIDRNEEGGRGAALFLDGSSYRPLFARAVPGGGEVRWHRDPNLMVLVAGHVVGTWHVRTGAIDVVAELTGYRDLKLGPYEGNLSRNGEEIVLTGKNPGGATVAFVFNLKERRKFDDIPLGYLDKGLDWASISASGRFVVVNDAEDRTVVLDREGKVLRRFEEYGRPSHYDLTLDAAGDDVAVGVSKSAPDAGRVIARRLRDGAVIPLSDGGYASHSSTRSTRRADWGFSDFESGDEKRIYNGEIIAYPLSGGAVYRLAHHHNRVTDYLSESHASPSPDGDRAIFASNWNERGGRPVQSYVVDFRDLCKHATAH